MAICLWLGAKAASILGSFSFSCLVNTPVVVKWVDGKLYPSSVRKFFVRVRVFMDSVRF